MLRMHDRGTPSVQKEAWAWPTGWPSARRRGSCKAPHRARGLFADLPFRSGIMLKATTSHSDSAAWQRSSRHPANARYSNSCQRLARRNKKTGVCKSLGRQLRSPGDSAKPSRSARPCPGGRDADTAARTVTMTQRGIQAHKRGRQRLPAGQHDPGMHGASGNGHEGKPGWRQERASATGLRKQVHQWAEGCQ